VVAEEESHVQVRRCGCRIELFTVDDHESELKHVMELVIVSHNYQFQHYIHFHEAKIKSSRTCRGQMLEAESEAEDKSSRPRPRTKFWPRGQLGLDDLTSLLINHCYLNPCKFMFAFGLDMEAMRLVRNTLGVRGVVSIKLYNCCCYQFRFGVEFLCTPICAIGAKYSQILLTEARSLIIQYKPTDNIALEVSLRLHDDSVDQKNWHSNA